MNNKTKDELERLMRKHNALVNIALDTIKLCADKSISYDDALEQIKTVLNGEDLSYYMRLLESIRFMHDASNKTLIRLVEIQSSIKRMGNI
jgi:hypothetical protein